MKWMLLGSLLIANCGFWLFCFNQINAFGIPRFFVKRAEKLFIVLCFLLPLCIALFEFRSIARWLFEPGGETLAAWWPANAPLFSAYGAWCAAAGCVLGVGWLQSRWWMRTPKHLVHEQAEDFHVHDEVEGGSPGNGFTEFLNRLPGNQICQLQATQKKLELPRRVEGVGELRIGHISDLHFTGQLRPEHYQYVVRRFMDLRPNIIFITGDIIDYDRYLEWIPQILVPLEAEYGVYFVLGNHDRRLQQQDRLLAELTALNFVDLGSNDFQLELATGTRVTLRGNEAPWYQRHEARETSVDGKAIEGDATEQELRIGLSHSPDQIHWARKNQFDLLFAGHTHGGQVRLPIVGPLVAPSHYGSRFASGVFHYPPTLMHVSRGVAGTHPLRWWCQPEVSLITLASPDPGKAA